MQLNPLIASAIKRLQILKQAYCCEVQFFLSMYGFFTTEHSRVNKLIIMPDKVIFCNYFYKETFYLMHFIMKRHFVSMLTTIYVTCPIHAVR